MQIEMQEMTQLTDDIDEKDERDRIYIDENYPNARDYHSIERTGFEIDDTGGLLGLSIYSTLTF